MKPEDFKPPYPKEERRTYIYDRVWLIPSNKLPLVHQYDFPGWEHADFFGNDHPISIEYCSGNGSWIASKAIANPHINWVAVEMKFDRVRKIWSKIKNHRINNLIVICGEALQATQSYFLDGSISDIYINFPDPWPKKRHIKNRLIQDRFVEEMQRILKLERSVTFVTDDPPYSEWFIETMSRNSGFTSLHREPYYVVEGESYGTSYFEELWRSKGKTIRYHKFQKIAHPQLLKDGEALCPCR